LIIPVLAYHEVYETPEEKEFCAGAMAPSCSISSDIFRKQLKIIIDRKVRVASFEDLSCSEQELGKSSGCLVLTFDDGHKGNYDYAFQFLKKNHVTAVFFVATGLIGSRKMMSWAQLKEMADHGMSIQSHGVSHEPFETLSVQQVREELVRSRAIIEDKVGQEVNTISLPHGSIHPRTLELAEQAGYRFVCTSEIDYFHGPGSRNVSSVPRLSIQSDMDMDLFADIVTGHCHEVRKWKRIQRVKHVVRGLVGINNYRRVYRLVYGIGPR